MNLINPLAEKYSETYSSTDAVLNHVYNETITTHPQAQMMSSLVQGKFLEFISSLIKPKYILEIGTFTGFSAICLARGLREGSELHTIEINEQDANTAWKNIIFAGLDNQIRLHRANALEIIKQLNYEWDLVFIDADKTGYIEYYELALPRLHTHGLIIADNTLFHGEVLEENITGKNATAIDAFNRHVAADERTEQVMLTIRDGLMLIKKIK